MREVIVFVKQKTAYEVRLSLVGSEVCIGDSSTARLGYYDFQVNRDRVERLRTQLVSEGVVRPLRGSAVDD
mgnify:CR=1 FL=1